MDRIRHLLNIDEIHKRGINGQNITVAVLDSGSYPHTDIKENIIYFKDFVSGRKNTYDDNSHGTHICGIIGGRGIVNKKYKGIAPHCYLLPIKVLDKSGHGRSESIINASDWIIRNKNKYNIRIVNISIGTKSSSCSEEKSDILKAVDNMWDNGITVLVSAGNNGPSYQSITIPGISRKVITVGSCKFDNSSYDGHFKYSGKGPTFCNVAKPDIVVPGDNITSCSPGNRYVKKSGTSMSTPIVAGAAALIFSYDNTLSNNNFKELLKNSADNLGLDRYTQGFGRLNIEKCLNLI